MKRDIEVIRYDEKGKKTIEHDIIEADGYMHYDQNNLIIYTGSYQDFANNLRNNNFNSVVVDYHSYNYISIQRAK